MEEARSTLAAMDDHLTHLRRAAGIRWLSDCIADTRRSIAALRPFDEPDSDLADPTTARTLEAATAVAIADYQRCREEAGEETRRDPEFTRLVDGALTALPLIRQAVDAQDKARLHSILIQLWSFDRLIWLRFG